MSVCVLTLRCLGGALSSRTCEALKPTRKDEPVTVPLAIAGLVEFKSPGRVRVSDPTIAFLVFLCLPCYAEEE
jgi:hypothetical protein